MKVQNLTKCLTKDYGIFKGILFIMTMKNTIIILNSIHNGTWSLNSANREADTVELL